MPQKWPFAWQNCSKNLKSLDFRAKFRRFQNGNSWNFAQKLGMNLSEQPSWPSANIQQAPPADSGYQLARNFLELVLDSTRLRQAIV
jgi:hypothetical protein